jgi:hypothetical protein
MLPGKTLAETITAAYDTIKADYFEDGTYYKEPFYGMTHLVATLNLEGHTTLAFWVLALTLEVLDGHTLARAYQLMMQRCAQGRSWRHVAYAGYKGEREYTVRR